jgi:hypothetical protein
MSNTAEDTILFSWVVALTAIIRITCTSTWIQDSDGTTRTFSGGTDEYEINVAKLGTGKKKNSSQSITIRKKLPVCPITGLPMPLKTSLMFKEGFALNQHIVRFGKHSVYNLNPGYYCQIGTSVHFIFYVVVKITDGRKMDSSIYNTLSSTLSCDIADLIKGKLEYMTKTDYDFKMVGNCIIPGKPYSRNGLRKLLDDGILEIAICGHDYMESNVVMLTPEAYKHVFPNGGSTRLPRLYKSCEQMMQFRAKYIEQFLSC